MADENDTPAASPLEITPRSRGRLALKIAAVTGATVLVTGALAAAGVAALWNSEGGTRWLLAHLPGITAVDVQGSLGDGDLRVGSLHADEAGAQVDIAGLRVRGLRLRWHPQPGAWLGVAMDDWEAASVRVRTPPSTKSGPPSAPTSLRSPVALEVAQLRIGQLAIGDAAPLRDVRAALALGTDGGALHRVDHLSFAWERVRAEGSLNARTDAPLDIDVALTAHDDPDASVPAPGATAPPASAPAPALPHWAATATLRGPLAALDFAAALKGDALPGRAPPQVQVSARVTPFAALPVGEVQLKTSELDLSALSAKAPATRLEGSARIATTRPAALDVDLRNLAPAAWSAGGLPVASLTARLEAPWSGESLAVPALRVVLADAKGTGGELRAQGKWIGDHADIALDVDALQLERLDAHLGAWRIAGPLRASFGHLPPPAALWGAAPPNADKAAAAAGAASAASASFAAWSAHVTGRLAGSAPAIVTGKTTVVAPPPMTLQLDAQLDAAALELKQFDLRAGAASLVAKARLTRGADDRWQGDASAQWAQLDPGAWWRLAESGPLRRGPHLLNGSLALQLAGAPSGWDGLAGLRGKVDVTIAPSQFAGLALEGRASLDANAVPWKFDAELHSGGNQARAEGTLAPGKADADALAVIEQLHVNVDAPALGNLTTLVGAPAVPVAAASSPAPVASAVAKLADAKSLPGELVAKAATKVATGGKTSDTQALAPALAPSSAQPAFGSGWPTRGSAKIDLVVSGGRLAIADGRTSRPPTRPLKIVTTGEIAGVAGGSLRVERLTWDAQAGSDPQAPLVATIALRDAQWGPTRITHADAALTGTLAEHRLQLQADAPVSPPTWLAHLASIGDANATRLDALLLGHWKPDAPDVHGWEGHLAQLDLRAANVPAAVAPGGAASAAHAARVAASVASQATVANPAWIHVQPVDFSLSRDAAGRWQTLRVGASQAEFAGLTLAWKPSSWTAPDASGASAHWAFDAALSPFSVAQVLARAQPDLGWHGDLQMAAQLHAAFDGQWHVDGKLQRTSGDLSVSELAQDANSPSQALGLSAALLEVKAEGLHWSADANIVGSRLGELSGTWTAEAPSPASLPTAGSPLRGHVDVHVADLNVWGAWLPPGWRLSGELRTVLALSGRWGDPQLTGELTAQRLGIRNSLEGVNARDGDLAIRLTGDRAQIERFHVLGGGGELTLAGSASLGATPVARLQLQANQFQLLGRIDRKIVATGNVALQLGADALKVDGKLAIDEGLFDLSKGSAPTLDSDVEVVDGSGPVDPDAAAAAAAEKVAAGEPVKTARTTSIALAVDLGQNLRLRGRGIDTLLRGALQITAPNGQLAVHGGVRTERGTYKAYGQNLQVTRGELTFTGPVGDPRLDILATRPNLDVVVGVAITGTALAPHVKLISEPEMSDADKLSWLMLGRAPEGLGSADTALLQQAAIALLAGEDEAPTDQLLKRLGLTDFSFRQQEDANDVRQTVVTLGRQLTRRWYVGYERGVNATTGSWQIIYRIAQRLTVRAQSGEDVATSTNGNSLDVIYTWKWN